MPLYDFQCRGCVARFEDPGFIMPLMTRFFTAAGLCLFVASTYAADGVVISMKTTGAGGGTTSTNQIQLDANHMRAEMAGRGGGENGVVFDGTKQTLYIIDDSKKTYSE